MAPHALIGQLGNTLNSLKVDLKIQKNIEKYRKHRKIQKNIKNKENKENTEKYRNIKEKYIRI